jgi:signal transduction histidine kinase
MGHALALRSLVRVDARTMLANKGTRGLDVLLATVFVVVIVVDIRQIAAANGRWPFVLGADVLICGLALLWRRNGVRAAGAALVIFGTAGVSALLWHLPAPTFTSGALAGMLVLGASMTRRSPARQSVLVALAGAIIIAATELVRAAGGVDAKALFGLGGIVLWAGALSVGIWWRYLDRRRLRLLEAVRRDERLQLARELHDVVAHHVTGIVVQAQAARFVGEDDPPELLPALASIETAATSALASMRRLVELLRAPDDLSASAGAPESLDDLVARFGAHGPAIELRTSVDLTDPTWPPELSTTVYRIVQEALTNVARHAPEAHMVTVSITRDSEWVITEVTDDAPSVFAPRSRVGGGYGLLGMRERVETLGGTLRAGPRPQAGWSVRVGLPLPGAGSR